MLPAKSPQNRRIFVDLGCGDGRVVEAFATRYLKGAIKGGDTAIGNTAGNFLGVEYDGAIVEKARERVNHMPSVEILHAVLQRRSNWASRNRSIWTSFVSGGAFIWDIRNAE